MATPWARGTMNFSVKHYGWSHTWISKEGECPSEFLLRILRTCDKYGIGGEQVLEYMKKDG